MSIAAASRVQFFGPAMRRPIHPHNLKKQVEQVEKELENIADSTKVLPMTDIEAAEFIRLAQDVEEKKKLLEQKKKLK